MTASIGFLVTQASTGLLVVLGAFLVWVRPRRRGTAAFGIAVISLGLAVFVQNMFLQGSMDDALRRASAAVVLLSGAFWLTSAVATTVAAFSLPRPLERSERAAAAWFAIPTGLLALVYALGTAAAVAAGPEIRPSARVALLLFALSGGIAVGAFFGAGALFAARFRAAPAGAHADRLHYALMTCGLVPYVAFSAGLGLGDPHLKAGGLVLAVATVYVTLLWLRATSVARDAHVARNVALLLPASALAGLVVSVAAGGFFGLDATGVPALVRLATFALLGYAILRHQLLGIDVKVKWTLKQSTLAGFFVVVFFAVSEGAEAVLSDRWGAPAGIAASAALLFAIHPLQGLAERVADRAMPGVASPSASGEDARRLQFRDHLDVAYRDGAVSTDERHLLELVRRQLSLSEAEAAEIEAAFLSRGT